MSFLNWQQTDKNQFAVFIRDISQNLNNVKHMIEDILNKPPPIKYPKKNKKVIKKKKDIIIEQQTKIRLDKQLKEDLSKIDYLIKNIDNDNPYISFSLMKTDKGLYELKFKMLEYFWGFKKTYFPHVMNLYFQLIDKTSNKHQEDLINDIQIRLTDTEYKLYMMKNLSYLLPPLNIHEPKVKQLDDWQIEVLNYIKNKESVIVKAPTSSGKSFIALSVGVIHKKILYVCPAKPIAYQVGAHFNMMGYKVHYLLDNLCNNSYDDKTNIFVGIPSVIEDNFYKIGINYDYVVFDEIHNLNKEDDGYIYENIIKMINCPFLALSATIGNIEFLIELFTKVHNSDLANLREEQRKKTCIESGELYKLNTNIRYIEYNKRFINQQKMIYEKGKLDKLHPLSCIEFDDLNDNFLKHNLQFTPYDSAILWETMEDVFDKKEYSDEFEDMIYNCSPDNYFSDDNKILTLDDTRDYEIFIKNKLVELSDTHPDEIKEILSKFHRVPSILNTDNTIKDIINLFRLCKQKDCLPMLVFNTDTLQCKKLFSKLFTEISKNELDEYPYHYDILEKMDNLYIKYKDKREQFINNIKIGKTNDAKNEKLSKIDRYDKDEENKYINEIINYYKSCIHDCERNDIISDELKNKQIKNLKKELKLYQKYPSFKRVDIFQKHKDFCFSNTDPMSGDQIRDIRREIYKTLGIKISYEHELFQMLKRGIGIYTEDMPEEYRWILQKLMDKKKIGIILTDRTLCLGIDLPIRSCCLLGIPGCKKFTIDDYLQMSGRAGRRGKDDRGNTIFYNLDFKKLMKGILPNIVGSEIGVPGNYRSLNLSVENVYKNFIRNKYTKDPVYRETKNLKLQWLLRYQDNVSYLIDSLDKWNKGVFQEVSDMDKEIAILSRIIILNENINIRIIDIYKNNLIDHNYNEFKFICNMLEVIYNVLKDKKYNHMKDVIKRVYEKCKFMILKEQNLY